MGIRSRVISWPDDLDRALSWLLHHMPMAPALVPRSDCSGPVEPISALLAASGEPLVSISFWWMAHQDVMVSADMPILLPS